MAQVIEIPRVGPVERGSERDRKLGALLGLAVGDALGTTYEFARIEQPPYPALATGPATDVVGGGPFHLAPGQITDDTHMAVCLARSLVERGDHDVDDVARRYVAWRTHAFDIGVQTLASLDRIAAGEAPHAAAHAVWIDRDRRAAGNGSLMRIAPLAVALAYHAKAPRHPASLIMAIVDESLVTHADPRCALACAMIAGAIARAVDHIPDRSASWFAHDADGRRGLAQTGCTFAASQLRDRWSDPADRAAIDQAERDLLSDLERAVSDDPGFDTSGFVRVALRLALWHDARDTPYRDAVVDVASRGGDADTNAAIVGALVGARDGVTAIPPEWIDRVLGATQPGPPEWADAHHPRHFLALVR
jgi:ADP-ribosylglycohydrolase